MSEQTDDLATRNRQMFVMQSRNAPKLNMYPFQHENRVVNGGLPIHAHRAISASLIMRHLPT
jgi:hypothetical protein